MTQPSQNAVYQSDVPQLLFKAFAHVLEQFAFMFAESTEFSELKAEGRPHLLVTLDFSGPVKGKLELIASADMCRNLAANILGVELDAVSREHATDAVKELLNVTCGEFLEALSGSKAVFNLSVPEVVPATEERIEALEQSKGAVILLVDEAPTLIHATLPS